MHRFPVMSDLSPPGVIVLILGVGPVYLPRRKRPFSSHSHPSGLSHRGWLERAGPHQMLRVAIPERALYRVAFGDGYSAMPPVVDVLEPDIAGQVWLQKSHQIRLGGIGAKQRDQIVDDFGEMLW